ncbi:MAG: protein kinase [Oscillatoriales cyanobacterium SM2_2_1]|nr:protein kinase [Oscillatoriales cyanobacterium SM2_2_1]
MVWQIGQQVAGDRYTITGIDASSNGIFYRAQTSQGQEVELFTLPLELTTHPQYSPLREQMRGEATILAQCRHPFLAEVIEQFVEGSHPCVVCHRTVGERLWDAVSYFGAMDEDASLQFICQVALALRVIHERGLVHRHVHPHSIIRTPAQTVQLTQFGFVREFLLELLPSAAETLDGFTAPELLQPKGRIGAFSDVYSLAATFYFLLTRTVPPSAIARELREPLWEPRQMTPSLNSRVNQAILRGMALSIGDRPANINEWLALLPKVDVIEPEPAPSKSPAPLPPKSPQPPPEQSLPSIQPPAPPRTVKRASDVAEEFQQLEEYLIASKWREADRETARLLLILMEQEKRGYLNEDDIAALPCDTLHTLDDLWIMHSVSTFGFSIQKKIWQNVGGTDNYDYDVYCKFGDQVQWRRDGRWLLYNELRLRRSNPDGFLPSPPVTGEFDLGFWGGLIAAFAARLEECGL